MLKLLFVAAIALTIVALVSWVFIRLTRRTDNTAERTAAALEDVAAELRKSRTAAEAQAPKVEVTDASKK